MSTTCPACPGRLHTATIGGVDRAQCDGCGGLWFERRKLEKALGGSLPSFGISETSERTCPKTGEQLLASTVEGVTLDWCATCAGVYLDPGEIDQIRAHAASSTAPTQMALDLGRDYFAWSTLLGFLD